MKLTCDLCGGTEDADDLTPDWNGDTGCHRSCEEDAAEAEARELFLRPIR